MFENIPKLSVRQLFHYNLGTITKFELIAMLSKCCRKFPKECSKDPPWEQGLNIVKRTQGNAFLFKRKFCVKAKTNRQPHFQYFASLECTFIEI